jgi:HAMP domain-containing protein
MSFFNLRIGGRLYVGFGALVLFCAALAGFAVWQLGGIHDQVGLLAFQSRSTIRVGEIATELQAIRRGLLRYAFDQNEASFAESDKHLSNITDLLEESARTTNLEGRRASYKAASNVVAELKTKRGALGEAMKQMLAGRNLLFTDGDKMAADVQKLVDATDQSSFADDASAVESKVLLVQIASWRMLATRDPKGLVTFRANVANAQQRIAAMEKADDLPADFAALLKVVKADVGKYAEAFDKTGPNLLLGDELYYKNITPLIADMTEKMDEVKASIGQNFTKTSAETEGRISSTITMQEMVAGAAVLVGLLIAFLIARGIIGPLSGLTSGMMELASGNFGVVLPGLDRKDEVGDMAQAVETFKVKAAEKARHEAEARIKQDQIAAQQRKADMIKLADEFEHAVGEHDGGARARAHHDGCCRVGGSFHQCAVGGVSDRGTDLVGQRDQPSGSGIRADGH